MANMITSLTATISIAQSLTRRMKNSHPSLMLAMISVVVMATSCQALLDNGEKNLHHLVFNDLIILPPPIPAVTKWVYYAQEFTRLRGYNNQLASRVHALSSTAVYQAVKAAAKAYNPSVVAELAVGKLVPKSF
jgi:hypothetical protein